MASIMQKLTMKKTGAGYTGASSPYFKGSTQFTGMPADTGGSAGGVRKPAVSQPRGGPGTLRTPLGGGNVRR